MVLWRAGGFLPLALPSICSERNASVVNLDLVFAMSSSFHFMIYITLYRASSFENAKGLEEMRPSQESWQFSLEIQCARPAHFLVFVDGSAFL